MSEIFNDEGEPMISAAALRFEAYLDGGPYDHDDYFPDNDGELLDPSECDHGSVNYSDWTAECMDCESLGLVIVHVNPWAEGTEDGDMEFNFVAWKVA